MRGIPIYEADCTDFSTNGLGFLLPTECTVEEKANGLYELTLVQPITDDYRWTQAVNGRLLKAVCPARESPIYEQDVESATTVTQSIYKVTRDSIELQQGPSYESKRLARYNRGTEVIYHDQSASGNWYLVTIREGGQSGYMRSYFLRHDRDITQTVEPEKPVGREGVKVTISREQLFRIYSVENDTETGLQTVKAMHIFYDQRNAVLNETYEPDKVSAAEAARHIMAGLSDQMGFTLHCDRLTGEISGKYDYCSPVEAWLDPDEGILAQAKGVMFRDNYDIYLLPDTPRDMGVTIRRGKNLIGVTVTTDDTDAVTRIIPCGKDKDGDPLFLNYAKDKNKSTVPGAKVFYIESPHVDDYALPRTKKIDYDVKVDPKGDFKTNAAARAELERLAYEDFENGCDLPTYGMDVDFVLLGQNTDDDLAEWAKLQGVHMFDMVTVIDETINLTSKVRVTGYVWNVLSEQYENLTLGVVGSDEQTIYSYNLPTGGISGTKIAPGTASGEILRSASIQYAKISQAAIENLATNTMTALQAHIAAIQAGTIDADELYTDLAKIAIAEIGKATIDYAQVRDLSAQVATIAKAQITTANIDEARINWAQIESLAAAVADVADARIGSAKIDTAQINNLNALIAEIADARIGSATIDTAQIKDLSAQVATIAKAQINTANINEASIDWATIAGLAAAYARIENGVISNASIHTANIDDLTAQIADVIALSAQAGDFEFATVRDMVASAMVLEHGVGDTVSIRNLLVTSANMLNATVGELVLHSDDGKYYAVHIDSNGDISTEEVTVTSDEIISGKTRTGHQIVETDMNVASLNATNLSASSAAIGQIVTKALTAEKITAAQAMLASATIPTLYTMSIQALGENLDLSANQSINMKVSQVYVDMNNISVGGRNLMLNTAVNFPSKYTDVTLTAQERGVTVEDWACDDAMRMAGYGGSTIVCMLFSPGSHGLSTKGENWNRLRPGQEYTYSLYLKNNHTTNTVRVRMNGIGKGYVAIEAGQSVRWVDTGAWADPQDGSNPPFIQINVATATAGDEFDVTFWHPQIEYGNKVTDWRPAPEDAAADLKALSDNVEVLVGHRLEIVSTSDILSDDIPQTTLRAKVWHGSQDVTDSLPASRFRWTRVTSDTTADTLWNNNHKGVKSITLGKADVLYSATYNCELEEAT